MNSMMVPDMKKNRKLKKQMKESKGSRAVHGKGKRKEGRKVRKRKDLKTE